MNENEQKGFNICISEETFKPKPYYATSLEREKNIVTTGYGMTYYPNNTKVKIDDKPLTETEARLMFIELWLQRKEYIKSKLNGAKTTDYQLGALISFCYQVGYGNFSKSQLLDYHIRGDYAQAAREFLSKTWTCQGGQELGGLVRRRKKEQALYRGERII